MMVLIGNRKMSGAFVMPFWKFAVVVVVLVTFTATLRHRLLAFPPGKPAGDVVMAVGEELPNRWFMMPAALRPEEGIVDSPMLDIDEARPAYGIVSVVSFVAMIIVATDNLVPRMVTHAVESLPFGLPGIFIGLGVVIGIGVAQSGCCERGQRAGEIAEE